MQRRNVLAALLCLISATSAHANERVRTAAIIAGDELLLEDGRTLRLAGIAASTPLAKAYTESFVLGKRLILKDPVSDRYGRLVAEARLDDRAETLQEIMLRAGTAFVFSGEARPAQASWYEAERKAHHEKRGIWKSPSDIPAKTAQAHVGTYAFLTGTVTKAERLKNKVFLSFGAPDRPAFTIEIPAKFLRLFRKRGADALTLEGKKIRVRGWIEQKDAPTITLTDDRQLEIEATL